MINLDSCVVNCCAIVLLERVAFIDVHVIIQSIFFPWSYYGIIVECCSVADFPFTLCPFTSSFGPEASFVLIPSEGKYFDGIGGHGY